MVGWLAACHCKEKVDNVRSNDDTVRTVSGVHRNTASCVGELGDTHRRIRN